MNELGSHYIRQMSVAIHNRATWLLAPLSLCIKTNEVSFVLSFSIDEKTYKAKHSNVEPLNIWCRFHAMYCIVQVVPTSANIRYYNTTVHKIKLS